MNLPFTQVDVFTRRGAARQCAGRRSRRRWPRRHPECRMFRALDQPERNRVPAQAERPAGRLSRFASSRPARELPFAGHPTLGSCHAWLEQGGTARHAHEGGGSNARSGWCGSAAAPAASHSRRRHASAPGRSRPTCSNGSCAACASIRAAIKASQWVDNGPGWVAVDVELARRTARDQARLRGDARARARLPFAPWATGRAPVRSAGVRPRQRRL